MKDDLEHFPDYSKHLTPDDSEHWNDPTPMSNVRKGFIVIISFFLIGLILGVIIGLIVL